MELKHQLSEGKLFSCHLLAESKKGKGLVLEEAALVIANNAEEARDKAEDWFKEENPGAGEILAITSKTEDVII